MLLRAFLFRLLLVLALLANGLPQAFALPPATMPAVAEAGGHESGGCHESATAPDAMDTQAGTGMDCCDGGDCACDCLHPLPVLASFAHLPGAPPRAGALLLPAASPRAAPPPLPSLRPPIRRA